MTHTAASYVFMVSWLDRGPDKFPLARVMFCKSVSVPLFEEIIETFYVRMLSTFITDSG